MRSAWKTKFFDPRLFRSSFLSPPPEHLVSSKKLRPASAHTYLRGAAIPSLALNKRVAVYNGITFTSFIVKKFMVGRKFGEFSLTKKIGPNIHISKKKKKKQK